MNNVEVYPSNQAVDLLSRVISEQLNQGLKVLWLVPGGSAIDLALNIIQTLPTDSLSHLLLTLTDERYGEVGHQAENFREYLDRGLQTANFTSYRVLQGGTMEEDREAYEQKLEEWLMLADFKIGLFGIGSDGHTAGIKPGSLAVVSQRLVESFTGEDYQRITTTKQVIAQLDFAAIYATGADKRLVLDDFINKQIDYDKQPAQILKLAKRTALFTDQQLSG